MFLSLISPLSIAKGPYEDGSDDQNQIYEFFQDIFLKLKKQKRDLEDADNRIKDYCCSLERAKRDNPSKKDTIKYYEDQITIAQNKIDTMDPYLSPAYFCKDGEGFFSKGHNRYFALYENRLYYFTKEEIHYTTFKGYIDLKKINSVSRENGVLNLYEKDNGRIWKLRSNDNKLLEKWFKHLSIKVRNLKQ